MTQLHEMEQHASARKMEIIRLVLSIQDLTVLFKELSVLVVDQVGWFSGFYLF